MRTWTQHTEQDGGKGYLVLPILLQRYLVKYGPGGVTFLTHNHSNRCILYVLRLSPLFYRFVY